MVIKKIDSTDDLFNDEEVDFDESFFDFDYGIDGEYEEADEVDSAVQTQDEKSDDAYQKTTDKIVEISKEQLIKQYDSKKDLQKILSIFFVVFIAVQFLLLIVLLLIKGFYKDFKLENVVILSYMTSVFVETLGAIIIMIQFAFDSKQETKILSILSSVISNFKVYNSSEHEK